MAKKSGPELDALVAEKVMGWRRAPQVTDQPSIFWLRPDGSAECYWSIDRFRPSADIAAAWEVVEYMRRNHLDVDLHILASGKNTVTVWGQGGDFHVDGGSMCEAICLAALEAAGVLTEE